MKTRFFVTPAGLLLVLLAVGVVMPGEALAAGLGQPPQQAGPYCEYMAVGEYGTILCRSGVVWTQMTSNTGNNLYGVWGLNNYDVLAMGWYSVIRQFDGNLWSPKTTNMGRARLYDAWCANNTNDCFYVGENESGDAGSIWHCTNGTCKSYTLPVGGRQWIEAIWGADLNNLYAVGWDNAILKYQPGSDTWVLVPWTATPAGTGHRLWDIWGNSATDIWVVGGYGNAPGQDQGVGGQATIVHYNGVNWQQYLPLPPNAPNLEGVWGCDPNNVMAVGYNGAILRYDGTQWASMASPTNKTLMSVWGTSCHDMVATGYNGTIIRFNGNQWVLENNPIQGSVKALSAVWGAPAYSDGGQNLLNLNGWIWGPATPGVSGAIADEMFMIKVTMPEAQACWYQDVDGIPLRDKGVRLEAEMSKSLVINSAAGFVNPYVSLQVLKNDGAWVYNYGGILNSRNVPGGPWVGEARDIRLPTDIKKVRAAFCVWNATPGEALARNVLLRLAFSPPPPPPPNLNLLKPDWTWVPATPGIAQSSLSGILGMNVTQSWARGCWLQDLPGAALQGKTVHLEGAMRKTALLNAPCGFVNPYMSLQVYGTNGAWFYNYGGILNSTAIPGGPFVTEMRNITLPLDLVTLRAAFCVWDATPTTAYGKDMILTRVPLLPLSVEPGTWDEAGPDTPSVLPEDGMSMAAIEYSQRLWLPRLRN